MISRRALAAAVMTRLATVTNATGYYGEVGQGLLGGPDVPDAPPVGPDGRVRAYYVLYPSPGTPWIDEDLCDTHEDLDWLVQITAAAGHLTDLLALVDRIDAALYRWAPVVAGISCTGLKPPPGFDPGPALRDRDVTPNRLWIPLQYRTLATT